ncbi:MAG: hypothetical protein M3R59_09675 [Verrucomicrobiota bacterium]|nr:hypothetical protein [Verrucomicrobiota bacterium]
MNNDEAKFILSGYRPDGADAGDAQFADALAQAERDPELGQWFARERRFDEAMSAALETVSIPPNLRADILAGGKISRPALWRGRRAVWAIAAVFVALACVVGVWRQQTARAETWQREVLAVLPQLGSAAEPFDHEDKNGVMLKKWLVAQNQPAPPAMPAALQALPALGCKTISSAGHVVSIICFTMPGGEIVHLAVTDETDSALAPPTSPRFAQMNGWSTVRWHANGHACMLATKASAAELRRVFDGTT